jgi:DNA-binding NarL/FixJ family response regulator
VDSPRDDSHRPVRVLVCDSDRVTARLMAADLRKQQLFEIFECCQSVEALRKTTPDRIPDILLLSVRLQDPISEVLNVVRCMRNEFAGVRTVVLSDAFGSELISEIFRAGARGFFDRADYDPEPLSRCIRCVYDGQVWAKSEHLTCVLDAFVETAPIHLVSLGGMELLTPRERDVVRLVADGFGNREVAQQLGLSAHTVKNYLFSVFEKIGVSNRAELIMYVLSNLRRRPVPASTGGEPRKPVSTRFSRTRGTQITL